MSEAILVNALEQLVPFLNEKNVLELVVRGNNKRIKAFQKVALDGLAHGEEQALVNKAIHALNANTGMAQRSLQLVQDVTKMQQLGLVLNGLNLFEDYSRAELISILKSFCAQNDMALTTEAEQDIDYYLEWLISNKPDNFANGREMRNLFETMYSNQANRLADELIISDDALTSLTVADLPQFVLERSRE